MQLIYFYLQYTAHFSKTFFNTFIINFKYSCNLFYNQKKNIRHFIIISASYVYFRRFPTRFYKNFGVNIISIPLYLILFFLPSTYDISTPFISTLVTQPQHIALRKWSGYLIENNWSCT